MWIKAPEIAGPRWRFLGVLVLLKGIEYVPMLAIFFFAQRALTQGIGLAGMKA